MAKKSKKKSVGMIAKIMRVVACIAMIPVFIVPFLSMFIWQTNIGNTTISSDGVGIFADWTNVQDAYNLLNKGELNTAIMTIASVLLVILCVVGALYIILVAASFFVKNDLVNKLIKFTGWIMAILAIVTTILLMITPLATTYSHKDKYIGITTTYKIILTGTAYMVISGIVAGLIAVVAEKIKK